MNPAAADPDRRIAYWLFTCCALLLALVMLGGATRLTGSGLSIVDWRPVTGILPPLGEAAWQAELDKYRSSPQYQKVNRGMSVDEFKGIFWLEYWHRVVARSLGLVFALPLAWFWWRGWILGRLRWELLGILGLGAAQGYLGWFMVKSGLVDVPAVSHYRLAAHLGLALVIYATMFSLGLRLRWPRGASGIPPDRAPARLLLGLLAVTIISGAFVAGLRAGLLYNTFPLMAGQWIPDGLLHLQPAWRNLLENHVTVQFTHRVLALTTLALVLAVWATTRRRVAGDRPARLVLDALLCAALLQVGLGIATLLSYVPVWLGTLHQGGAVLLLSATLALQHWAPRRHLPR